MAVDSFLKDADFQDHLIALLCRDGKFCHDCAHLLTPKDFHPEAGQKDGRNRWIAAERILAYYHKYHEPVRKLLRAELLVHAQSLGLGERQTKELLEYGKQLQSMTLVGVESMTDHIVQFKKAKLKSQILEEMLALHSTGELTDDKWLTLSRQATELIANGLQAVDILDPEQLDMRIERRHHRSRNRNPSLLIEPLDAMVRMIGRSHLGLVIAPYKRGKSMFLIWIAMVYAIQRLKVLYITLEDPQEDVEDRFDAATTALPIHRLHELPKTLRARQTRFKRLAHQRIRVYDGTKENVSIDRVEQIYLHERDLGFAADAVILDYDDEVTPSERLKDRRMEFAQIYRDYRKFLAKYDLIGWTAAQTQRETENIQMLTADKLAEDISKVRKATMAISLGKGEWDDESIYLWVAAHKFDKQHCGCHIYSDKSRMLIYDRERTLAKIMELANQTTEAEE